MRVRERPVPRSGLTVSPVVVVVPDGDPPVLGGDERGAQNEPADDCRRQAVEAGSLPGDGRPILRQDVVRRAP